MISYVLKTTSLHAMAGIGNVTYICYQGLRSQESVFIPKGLRSI